MSQLPLRPRKKSKRLPAFRSQAHLPKLSVGFFQRWQRICILRLVISDHAECESKPRVNQRRVSFAKHLCKLCVQACRHDRLQPAEVPADNQNPLIQPAEEAAARRKIRWRSLGTVIVPL